jgi:hypothetical protein
MQLSTSKVFTAGPQDYKSTTSGCRIVVFHYEKYNPNDTNSINDHLKVKVIDISNKGNENNPILSFNYSKSNNSASGQFSFTLLPTKNWNMFIRPGDWVAAYLTKNSDDYIDGWTLRCVGTVSTIVTNDVIVDESGQRQLRYAVTGQDFGKVFEKYDVWINPYAPKALKAIMYVEAFSGKISGNPGEIVSKLIDMFLGYTGEGGESLEQWYVPYYLDYFLKTGISPNMFERIDQFMGLGLSSAPMKFLEVLTKNIQSDLAGLWMIWENLMQDKLWNILGKYSNPYINEMFCELDDVNYSHPQPAIYLRTNPFSFQDSNILPSENKFLNLPEVVVKGSSIFEMTSNFNDNERMAMILMTSNAFDALASSDCQPSIVYLMKQKMPELFMGMNRRYGLTLMMADTAYALISIKKDSKGQIGVVLDPNILVQFNKLLYHWYKNASFFENANIVISAEPKVRLGKRLTISDSPSLLGQGLLKGDKKSYYIEGYEDIWRFGQTWLQRLILTRGVVVSGGKEYFVHEKYSGSDTQVIGLTDVRRE